MPLGIYLGAQYELAELAFELDLFVALCQQLVWSRLCLSSSMV